MGRLQSAGNPWKTGLFRQKCGFVLGVFLRLLGVFLRLSLVKWEFFSAFQPQNPFWIGSFSPPIGCFSPLVRSFSPLLFRPPKSKKGLVGVKTTLIPFSSFKYFLSQIIAGGIPIETFSPVCFLMRLIFIYGRLRRLGGGFIYPPPKKRLQRLIRLLFSWRRKTPLQPPPPLVPPEGYKGIIAHKRTK